MDNARHFGDIKNVTFLLDAENKSHFKFFANGYGDSLKYFVNRCPKMNKLFLIDIS